MLSWNLGTLVSFDISSDTWKIVSLFLEARSNYIYYNQKHFYL